MIKGTTVEGTMIFSTTVDPEGSDFPQCRQEFLDQQGLSKGRGHWLVGSSSSLVRLGPSRRSPRALMQELCG